MNLVYFHTDTIRSSWYVWAAARTMRQLGHMVLDVPIPCNHQGQVLPPCDVASILPHVDLLWDADHVIVAGPEYLLHWLCTYGSAWPRNKVTGLLLESSRQALWSPPLAAGRALCGVCYAPDPYDCVGLLDCLPSPVGIDTDRFRPGGDQPVSVAFVGCAYPSRREYLDRIGVALGEALCVVNPGAYDAEGRELQCDWTDRYVRELQQTQILISLPSSNPMPVARPFEGMACGALVLEAVELPSPLVDGVHYRRYHDPADCARLIRHYLAHPTERDTIAAAGLTIVREHFNARRAWTQIIEA